MTDQRKYRGAGRFGFGPRNGAAAVLVFSLLFFAGSALAQQAEPSLSADLRQGKIVTTSLTREGVKVRGGKAEVLLDAPLKKVMAVVEDYDNYKKFLPFFHVSRTLAKRGANAITYMEAKILNGAHTIWVEVTFRERKSKGSSKVIEGKMNRGNVNLLSLRWEAAAVDGDKTLLSFEFLVDPDLPIPSSVISDQNAVSARRTVRALRKRLYGIMGKTG